MGSSRHRLAVAKARMKIVKPDIPSVVSIGPAGLSEDEGQSSSGVLRLRERRESVEAFRDRPSAEVQRRVRR
jgi:hypothetical protein